MLTRSTTRANEKERAEAARATALLIAGTSPAPQLESTLATGTVTITPDDAATQPSRDPSESGRNVSVEPDNSDTQPESSEESAIPRSIAKESGRSGVREDAQHIGEFK